jgi:glycosyltransferase involved in cell wall biosynthesis
MLTPDRQIDRRILLQADSLEAAGWQVIIVGMPLDREAPGEDRRVVRIGGRGPGPGTAGVARRENMVLALYRWIRRHLPMNGWWMRTLKGLAWRYVVDQETFYVKLFAATALSYAPRVFVAHDLPMLPVARAAAARAGAKLVYDSHELYCEQGFPPQVARRWTEIEARLIGACDAVITVNPAIAAELQRRYGVPAVHVVYNAERAADAQRDEDAEDSGGAGRQRLFHEALALPPDHLVLLYQGGVSAGRHIEVLVEAMAAVRDPRIHLVVLGDGQLKAHLGEIRQRRGLAARVHLLPAVAQRDLLRYTAAADAGVIPYQATCLNNRLCTPNKLFEFIAAGLPILASDLPEIRRIVTTHGLGVVADLSHAPTLAAQIDAFFADAARLQGWRARVVAARREICWEREGEKVVRIFEAFR